MYKAGIHYLTSSVDIHMRSRTWMNHILEHAHLAK